MLKPLMDDEVDQLTNSDSIDESFIILQHHMTFFNYEPLKHIIDGGETGSDDLRQKMEDYVTKFKLYCKHRLFRISAADIGMCPTDARGNEREKFALLVLRDDQISTLTHDELEKLKDNIATMLGLTSSTLHIDGFDQGSLILVLSVPKFVYRRLFPLSQVLASDLKKNGYVLFTVPDTCTETTDTQAESHGKPSHTYVTKHYIMYMLLSVIDKT